MAIYLGELTLHNDIIVLKRAHVNKYSDQMSILADRLREERQRLGLNQDDFAAAGGVQRRAQANYEKGERHPDTAYLAAIASVGADVVYIVTGRRDVTTLSSDEADLVRRYREAPLAVKAAAVAALTAGAAPAKYQQNFEGATIGQQITDTTIGKIEKLVGIKKKKK